MNRGDDVLVTGAATQIAVERVADLSVRRLRVLGEQVGGGHDHAGRAEAALQPVLFPEGLLQRVQRAISREPLDGGDLPTFRLDGEHGAALHRLPIHVDGAGTALARVAADVGAGEIQLVAQHVREQRPWLDLRGPGHAVHVQGDGPFHNALSWKNREGG